MMKTALNTALGTVCFGLLGLSAAMAADLPSKVTPLAAPAPFFLFQDTSVSYRIETSATDVGSQIHFIKNIANLTHVDAYQYGTNFFSLDWLQSTSADPAGPVAQNAFAPFNLDRQGATEFYGVYRGTLSGNALTHSKSFSLPMIFLKDISLSYGGDGEIDNTAISPNKRLIVGGIQFAFDVPGFLTLAVHASHEWGHNGLTQTGGPLAFINNVGNPNFNTATGTNDFKVAPEFEITYLQPLTFTGLPLSISGFANVVMPKGKDGFNSNSRTEILTAERLTLDLGKVAFNKPNLLDVFVGYKYWMNKFGVNGTCNNCNLATSSYTPGTFESQVFGGVALHVF